MKDQTFVISNPFSRLGNDVDDITQKQGFGAVLARAGVGKTALLVQLALSLLLRGKNVLHISLNDPVDKVGLWYKEVFNNLSEQTDVSQSEKIWESILPHRFIMTFKVEGFSVPKLEERLTDLTEQNIFAPDMVIIDGLPFDNEIKNQLNELKILSERHSLSFWFTVTTHRHEETLNSDMPPQIQPVKELFDSIIQLKPEGKMIHVFSLKETGESPNQPSLVFDPATMMLKEKNRKA